MATAAITGTAGDGCTESDIVTGGQTIIITLTGDTWIAAGGGTTYFGECNTDGSLLGTPAGYDYGGPAWISNTGYLYT